ncbi:MAG TPA: CDP-alcohol phosphatidyltransferase family protein [Polyangia bacterium]|nr:CDP-alcohol phosphatidyltransferase family protein [Polyangia bacterium]
MRLWRFAVPNLITATSLTFAFLSVMNAISGHTVPAAWFALYCVLTDKLDGFAARLLGATSAFGVQFDSFADFASFGVAPATLFYSYLSRNPALGFQAPGPLRVTLQVATVLYVLLVAFRLARFNVSAPTGGTKLYFGVPTTQMGGTLLALFVTFLKYGDPHATGIGLDRFHGPHLLGHTQVPTEAWHYWPLIMLAGGALMVSRLRVPKLGLTQNRVANAIIVANILGVYGFGVIQWLPEYLAGVGLAYLGMSVIYGQVVQSAREATRPPLFAGPQPPHDEDEL